MPGEGWLLAVETATDHGGVALLKDGAVVAERGFDRGMVHGRDIAPSVESLTREAGIGVRDLGVVAVDIGPGSYTGVRVGMAAAKGLCYALGRPIVGVCSLDAMAERAADAGALCAVLDAKWRQVYAGTYEGARRTGGPWALEPAEVRARIVPGMTVVGDGAKRFPEAFAGFPARPDVVPRAAEIGRIGARLLRERGADDLMRLLPLYLRATEAEEKRGLGDRV